jgi:hypothetical protein
MTPSVPVETPEASARLNMRQLRFMGISTALLVIPQLARIWHSAFAFEFIGLFSVPTGLILTAAIAWSMHRRWRDHLGLLALAALNLVLALALVPLMLR